MTNQKTTVNSVKERAKQKLERDMGASLLEEFNHPKTVELMLNDDGNVWIERLGEKMKCIGQLRPAQSQAIIETIAGFHGKEVTRETPILEGEFPLDGSRFAGQLPPIVLAPTFAIRKKSIFVFTLEEYVNSGVMTEYQKDLIIKAVKEHKNILIVGGTGSGKTTLINAVINEMVTNDPTERICIIEDTGEIQCVAKNRILYHTTLNVSMNTLLKVSLRMRPDRIIVGEVRGGEAMALLKSWNTGHEGGTATIHANDAILALSRMQSLIAEAPEASNYTPDMINSLISEAVHFVVHISRTDTGRRVESIIEVLGYENGQFITKHF